MEDNFSRRINSCGGSNPLLFIFRRDIYYVLFIHRFSCIAAFVGPAPVLPDLLLNFSLLSYIQVTLAQTMALYVMSFVETSL